MSECIEKFTKEFPTSEVNEEIGIIYVDKNTYDTLLNLDYHKSGLVDNEEDGVLVFFESDYKDMIFAIRVQVVRPDKIIGELALICPEDVYLIISK